VTRHLLTLWLVLTLSACSLAPYPDQEGAAEATFRGLPLESERAFEQVVLPRDYEFPEDHGPHTRFQTEWWYYTGNLVAQNGARLSYQLTIFRRGLSPEPVERRSNFATNQIYFAHFAIASIDREEHRFFERFSRGALGLAGASNQPFEVFLEDWRISALDPEGRKVRIKAAEQGLALDLVLEAVKPIVVHGEGGVSAKSTAVGNASYYLSFTRMETVGSVQFGGVIYQVEGESWFDHEWSTSALAEGVIGWDWFSLQLEDQRELMLYVLRRADGSVEPVSAGTLVRADGSLRYLEVEKFSINVLDQWESPESGAVYPSAWKIAIPDEEIELEVIPTFKAQEMRVSFTYWEGSVMIEGTASGEPINGLGFVELTGYLESMTGVF
jgi:predicted secreted hydrolase